MKNKINQFKSFLSGFAKREDGVTAIEYALIASGIAIVIIAAVNGVGTQLTTVFNNIKAAI